MELASDVLFGCVERGHFMGIAMYQVRNGPNVGYVGATQARGHNVLVTFSKRIHDQRWTGSVAFSEVNATITHTNDEPEQTLYDCGKEMRYLVQDFVSTIQGLDSFAL